MSKPGRTLRIQTISSRVKQWRMFVAVVGLCWVWVPGSVSAITQTPAQETLEVLMSAQQDDTLYITRVFGPDTQSPLHFTSTIDPSARTFTYMLTPGNTYLGQPIALSAQGTFNLGSWGWSSQGQLGTTSWSGLGDVTFFVSDDIQSDNLKIGPFDFHSLLANVGGLASTTSVGSLGFTFNDMNVGGTFNIVDFSVFGGDPFGISISWTTAAAGPYTLMASGTVDLATGQGGFTLQVVPEPSTLLLLGSGLVSLLAWKRKLLLPCKPSTS